MMQVEIIKFLDTLDLSERRLPLIALHGRSPGPVVWLVANTHGDETAGIAVIHRVLDTFKNDTLKAGTLYLMPLMNPTGSELTQRAVAMDGEDMNRVFPGKANGKPSERLAHLIYERIVASKPALVIDLHTYSTHSLPFIILDRVLDEAAQPDIAKRLYALADVFGLTVTYDFALEQYRNYRLDRSLTGALLNHGKIPAYVVELGPGRIISKPFVEAGERGVYNILRHLGMMPPGPMHTDPTRIESRVPLRRDPNVNAGKTGIVDFMVAPGDRIRRGQAVALVRNILGEVVETVTVNHTGYVIALMERTSVFPGMYLMTIAVPESD